ncbi:MAG: type II toxin-antitoxin system VapC family toxin [Candidatus Limnocylindrales bacterium]
MNLFVDSSTFFAAVDSGDERHADARRVLAGSDTLLTSDHVLAETWSLIDLRLGWSAAERFWAEVRKGSVDVVDVVPADLEVAWSIGEAFPDQGFSLTDRTSFAVMLRLGVHRAASLDKDFAVFRFGAKRDRAFEIFR